jgi:hypothetical protein
MHVKEKYEDEQYITQIVIVTIKVTQSLFVRMKSYFVTAL